jgi:hypothetical protein
MSHLLKTNHQMRQVLRYDQVTQLELYEEAEQLLVQKLGVKKQLVDQKLAPLHSQLVGPSR